MSAVIRDMTYFSDIVPDDMSRKELVDLAYKLLDEINDQQEEIRDLKDELEERHDEMLFQLKYGGR